MELTHVINESQRDVEVNSEISIFSMGLGIFNENLKGITREIILKFPDGIGIGYQKTYIWYER